MKKVKKLIAVLLCLAMLPCTFLSVFAESEETQTNTVEDGTVLYYQQFGKDENNNIISSIDDAGMEQAQGGSINDENGYLKCVSTGSSRIVGAYLPIDLRQTDSYTVEFNFKYTTRGSANYSCLQIGWGEVSAPYYHLFEFQGNYGLKVTEYVDGDDTTKQEVTNSWPNEAANNAMKATGQWINTVITVEDNYVKKIDFTPENGTTFTMDNSEKQYSEYPLTTSNSLPQLYFRMRYATAEIKSVRITKGINYTEYKGQYATTSYNGYEDPMVNNVGLQEAINADSVRLVGEIRGTEFDAAGFEMNISYTDNKGNPQVSSETLVPEAVHSAYTSIKAGNGTATPSSLNYYLIVLEISEIPTDITDVVITFKPYAKSGTTTHYGSTYVYNHTTKAITIAE